MDSGNSGSISSSGDEEYDSRSDMVPPFLNPHPQFGSLSFVSHHHHQTLHPPLFDLSPNYLQSLSSQTHHLNSNPTPFLNLDTGADSQDPRSEPNCTAPLVSSSSSAAKQSVLNTDPSLQLRSLQYDNARVSAPPANAVRNPKKRTRASRRAPTTVLTTDTSNFRAMVQEFTGIPAPPFSGTSYSRRLDLLTASSSLRSSAAAASSHLDTTTTTTPSFYPLRPLLLSSTSSSPSPSSTLMLHNHVADAVASTTTGNNTSSSINFQTDAGASYSHQQNMLTMQILPFQTPTLRSLNNPTLHVGFSAKSHQPSSSSIPSLEDQLGMGHTHLMSAHPHMSSSEAEGLPLSGGGGGGGGHDIGGHAAKDQLRSFHVAAPCKLNFSGTSSSAAFNPEKNLENTSTRGEGNIDSWICSSD